MSGGFQEEFFKPDPPRSNKERTDKGKNPTVDSIRLQTTGNQSLQQPLRMIKVNKARLQQGQWQHQGYSGKKKRYQTSQKDNNREVHRKYHYGGGISYLSMEDWDTKVPIKPKKAHMRRTGKPKNRSSPPRLYYIYYSHDMHIHAYQHKTYGTEQTYAKLIRYRQMWVAKETNPKRPI